MFLTKSFYRNPLKFERKICKLLPHDNISVIREKKSILE